ncbi:MAG TPA: AgmX/PglI C-terminal domain-containing protein [Polyangia bacterium]
MTDSLGGRAEWYVAIAGVRSGPFMRAEAAQMILAVDSGKTVHVWKDGMSGWKPSEEVSVIARELSVLRKPAAQPPLPPPKPVPAALPVGPLKVAAMPAAAAKAAKATESQSASLLPGKPLKTAPVSISDALDFVVDTDPVVFSDIKTDKAKNIQDLANAQDDGSFADGTTKADVTTKKGKNLRDLEAGPRFASTHALSKSEKTPPPAPPLPPRANKVAERGLASSSSASLPAAVPSSPFNLRPATPSSRFNLPAAAPAVSFTSPGIGSADTSSPALPVLPAVAPNPSELGGFAEVIRAEDGCDQGSDQGSEPQQAFPELSSPPMDAVFPAPISADAGGAKGLGRPGLKFLVAACVIVGLVILIVMVTLRMDSRKVPDLEPAPSKEPAAEPEPEPAVAEPPKPEPAAEEKPGQGTRAAGKRGSARSVHHMDVGPAPERQPTHLQPAKPGLAARPNPFDEAKTVSQSQISAVVRNKANQDGLKTCYDRALKMDNHLTSGRVDVTVSIGASGVVQRVVINAPASFILVEPCIKSAVKRWVFPPSAEEYGTNFPLIMQGGM